MRSTRPVGDLEGVLRRQIAYCMTAPFYRQRCEELDVDPTKVRSLEDLSQLPILVTPDLHRQAQEESLRTDGHPFGTFLCARPDEIISVQSTSGTTGSPTFYPFTRRDVEITDLLWIRALRFIGVRPGDVVLQGFGLSMYLAGLPLVRAVERMGATAVPVGAESGTEKLLRMARLVRPRVLACTPSYASYLLEKVPEVLGGLSARDLGVEIILCAGEPGAGLPEVREKLEDGWGAAIHDVLGGAHGIIMASGPGEYVGMHVLSEDYCVTTDLVDPTTKEPIEVVDGATGERVKTSLEWGGAPPLRYSVGDIYQVFTEPLPSLPPGPRVKVLGRVDDLLIIKGVKLYPAAVKDVVSAFAPDTTGELRIVLDGPPPRVTPPLRLKVEYGEGVREGDLQGLRQRLIRALHDRLTVRPEVELVAPGTLPRSTHKTQLIEISAP